MELRLHAFLTSEPEREGQLHAQAALIPIRIEYVGCMAARRREILSHYRESCTSHRLVTLSTELSWLHLSGNYEFMLSFSLRLFLDQRPRWHQHTKRAAYTQFVFSVYSTPKTRWSWLGTRWMRMRNISWRMTSFHYPSPECNRTVLSTATCYSKYLMFAVCVSAELSVASTNSSPPVSFIINTPAPHQTRPRRGLSPGVPFCN